ncbi:Os05g0204037 [Oryza sativa Japonica Group]|uniref:Os05g0204037 protein n=1 Tax=Oryza sativa subsp. japonica TaxID=39947 RepID=A0A0P0WJ77_ORYSJ|nr:Os05g0204037 [Oryza sativa Japonica Group]
MPTWIAEEFEPNVTVAPHPDLEKFTDKVKTHAQRQFFRDCSVSGTIDFIYCNSQASGAPELLDPATEADGEPGRGRDGAAQPHCGAAPGSGEGESDVHGAAVEGVLNDHLCAE